MKAIAPLLLLLVFASARAEERFFPKGSLDENAERDEEENSYYAKFFQAFKEPSLMTTVEKGEAKDKVIYRFLWLRSFHRPICIELARGEEVTLTVKVLDGKGGYKPGKLISEKSTVVEMDQFEGFLSLLCDDADFHHLIPRTQIVGEWTWNAERKECRRWGGGMTDGANWILEYCSDNKYYFVERRNPAETKFGKACLYLVELAGLKDEKVY